MRDHVYVAPAFPSSESLSVGTFWIADEPPDDNAVTKTAGTSGGTEAVTDRGASGNPGVRQNSGLCRIEDGVIEVDVVGEMTPSTSWTKVAKGVMAHSSAPDTSVVDVYGTVPIAPWRVSFLECRTRRRRGNALGAFNGESGHQVLSAVWAVVGAHVTTQDLFTGVRMRVGGLEEWSLDPGLEQTISRGDTIGTGLSFTTLPKVSAPFTVFGEDASIAVETVASASSVDVHGGQIHTWKYLALANLSGWTLQDAMSFFVLPVQTLMTLLTGSSAQVRSVEVLVGERWCAVFGRFVDGGDLGERPVSVPMLLSAQDLTLEHVATWLGVAVKLSPAPQVVAAGLAGEFRTVDTQALVLATAAEGLDRRLRPKAREFTEEVIAHARSVLADAEIDERLRDKIVSAVSQYMGAPSMPQRLGELAAQVAGAAPDCVGQINKWKSAVTTMRNDGAHGLAADPTATPGTPYPKQTSSAQPTPTGPDEAADELLAMYALAMSVRWALRIRVLQACGVSNAALSDGLDNFKEYQRDHRHWRSHWPKIYPSSG